MARPPLPGPAARPGRSFGLSASLPLGLVLHGAALWLLIHSSLAFRSHELPEVESHQILLFAPPAAALRLGDPGVPEDPEDRAADPRARVPREPAPLVVPPDFVALAEEIAGPAPSFGMPEGILEGLLDGLEFGTAEGVVGGLPGGVPGGQIGGLPEAADPVLPAPDEPPVPIALPEPRFPGEALRDGVEGRVVLRALISVQGTVEVLRVLRSVPALDAEAIRVVESEWRFRPARLRGRPTPALSDLVVRFTLR